jgi:5'-nucleotidase
MKKLPDLVVSGINRGANLGQDVYYSGTVSAAREACILGIPALSVSLAVNFQKPKPEDQLNYGTAAVAAVKALRSILKEPLPHHTMFNLNVPDVPQRRLKGIRLARQGFRYYSGSILRRKDHRGKDYYWVGGRYKGYRKEEDTDCFVLEAGYAALTPLKLDSTDLDCLFEFREKGFEGKVGR